MIRGILTLVVTLTGLILTTQCASADTSADVVQGREIYLDRNLGHCLLCHRAKQIEAPFQGTIGPDLSTVGSRLSPSQIRAKIVNPLASNPHTVMPAYYKTDGLNQVAREYQGKPILSAVQIEHVVAFVSSLQD
jgi:L-cysteine S-thiosulfotransferase